MLHVPYRGVASVLTDLLAGRLSAMMLNMLTANEHVETGKLRALGVTSSRRSGSMPNLPTIAEQGLTGFEALQWFGLFAPKGTPKPIVDKIQQEMVRGLNSPKMKQQLAIQGAEPSTNTSAEFAAFLSRKVRNGRRSPNPPRSSPSELPVCGCNAGLNCSVRAREREPSSANAWSRRPRGRT